MSVRADEVLRALRVRHECKLHPEVFFTEVKSGPTMWAQPGELSRLDGLAISKSWKNPCLTGYEVKVSRSDFLADHKWPNYLELCHEFSFACPSGLIQPEELSAGVGLVWYNPERRTLTTKRKPVYRTIEIPWELLYYLVICRIDPERHPFFSSRRAQIEAWLDDKEKRQKLGDEFKGSLFDTIRDLQKALADTQADLTKVQEKAAAWDKLDEILTRAGCHVSSRYPEWDLRRLEERLNTGFPPWALAEVRGIAQTAARIAERLTPKEPTEEADQSA